MIPPPKTVLDGIWEVFTSNIGHVLGHSIVIGVGQLHGYDDYSVMLDRGHP